MENNHYELNHYGKKVFGRRAMALNSVDLLIRRYGHRHSELKHKRVSDKTRHDRKKILNQIINDLYEKGFRVQSIGHLKNKHLKVIFEKWAEQNLSGSAWQTRLSILRQMEKWQNRQGFMQKLEYYGIDPLVTKRVYVSEKDHSWSTKIDDRQKIEDIKADDKIVGYQLELIRAFGMRAQESWMFRPHEDSDNYFIYITHGSKGGRPREVRIETEEQEEILETIKRVVKVKSFSLTPRDYTMKKWSSHFYYICRKHGIKRSENIVVHGLRHQRLIDIHEEVSGRKNDLRTLASKEEIVSMTAEEKKKDHEARLYVAEVAGHGRKKITNSYIGNVAKSTKSSC